MTTTMMPVEQTEREEMPRRGTARGSTELASALRLLVLSYSYDDDYNDDHKDGKIVSMSSIISQWGLAS